ncbi:MAG: hypothetical protein U0R65_14260 [Candidatus Nanopelagicales bacterium]
MRPVDVPDPASSPSLTPARILLGLGAALLIAAAAAFIAYAWTVIGPAGRTVLISAVAIGFILAAVLVRPRALRETFAVVGMGTVAVELIYGYSVGVIPDGTFATDRPWLTITFAILTVALWALGRYADLLSARIAAGVSYVGGVFALLVLVCAWPVDVPGYAAVVLTGGLGLAAALTTLTPRLARMPSVRAFAAIALGLAATLAVAVQILVSLVEADPPPPVWIACLAVLAGTCTVVTVRAQDSRHLAEMAAVAAAGLAGGSVGLALGLAPSPVLALALATLVGLGGALALVQRRRSGLGVAFALGVLLLALGRDGQAPDALVAVTGSAAALTFGYAVVGRRPEVVWASGPLAVIAGWTALATWDVTVVEAYSLLLLVAVLATLAVASKRALLPRERAIDAALLIALASTVPSAIVATVADRPTSDVDWVSTAWLSVAVTAIGIAGAFTVAARRRALRPVAIAGSAVLLIELWTLVSGLLPGDATGEYYVWTAYIAYAAAALVLARRRTVLGMGAIVAASASVLPAGAWAWDVAGDAIPVTPWLSVLLTLAGSAALAIVGVRRRSPVLLLVAGTLVWIVVTGVAVTRLWPDDWRTPIVVSGIVALATGLACRRVVPTLHSLWAVGVPGSLVLVPFAVDPGTRPDAAPAGFAVVVVAAAVVSIAGARGRTAGLLLPGALSLAIIAIALVWHAAAAMPAWLWLALAGGALLTAGVRLETTRAGIRHGVAWMRELD